MNTWKKWFQAAISLIFLAGILGPAVISTRSLPNKAHPLILKMAAEAPEQVVSVIVQKAESSDRAEELVAGLGGQVTQDLHIINAFSAELAASAAQDLAASQAVRWVSLDAPVEKTGKGNDKERGNNGKNDKSAGGDVSTNSDDRTVSISCSTCFTNTYLDTLGVRPVWEMGYRGEGVAIAVIDSGVSEDNDFNERIPWRKSLSPNSKTVNDVNGHGTHVAGIIAGDGEDSSGAYMGIAPGADLISLKVSDERGMAYESDVVAALQWVLDNKDKYNIRVVNMSINSSVESSYHTDPMDAAAEILWFNGVVVVVSSGNSGWKLINMAPANDPFLITVGATEENGTSDPSDDSIAAFTSSGKTSDGFFKPEIYAPGKDIISVLSDKSDWDKDHPDRVILDGEYFRLSGTSMAAPMVAGAAALLLQAEPGLTPDQVKYRLMDAGSKIKGKPYLNIYAAITTETTESANTGIEASQMLWTGDEPITWDSVNWNSVNWNSVNWNSVNWNSVNWNSVNWNSVIWDE